MNPPKDHGLLSRGRTAFLRAISRDILSIRPDGAPNNADKDSRASVAIAVGLIEELGLKPTGPPKLSGQSAGSLFERACEQFLRDTFLHLGHLRPGKWHIETSGRIDRFEQYSHLAKLEELTRQDAELAAVLGREYAIAPDVIVARYLDPDSILDGPGKVVSSRFGTRATLRESGKQRLVLHASISCKWTLRSDRAQNARSEALNLTRTRRGRVPHITVLTAEPLPSRISSLALGTDIDCVYHIALDGLIAATSGSGHKKEIAALETMVSGKRLRDLTDLPLDLCV